MDASSRIPPREIMDSVNKKARQLGREFAGDDLFLLGLSELPDEPPARRALEAEGLDSQRILGWTQQQTDLGSGWDGEGWLRFPPAIYSMFGRAVGFAASLGEGRVSPESVLLALLWDPWSRTGELVREVGSTPERIIAHLKDMDVPVPKVSPPAYSLPHTEAGLSTKLPPAADVESQARMDDSEEQ